jgi:predicted phosphodiesterase
MRIAVIADIHSNLEALQAVLTRIQALNADEIVCLGDLVGYNANPNECVDIVRNERILSILGNHDACASGLEEPNRFNELARRAVLWTRERLTDENRFFLTGLPREKKAYDCFLFHGSIHDTNRYITSRDDIAYNFQALAGLDNAVEFGFFGHTHVMTSYSDHRGIISQELLPELYLSADKRYLINPGSVGQPRDGDHRAAFLVYDREERTVHFYREEYDIKRCQAKITKAGLPSHLAARLEWGL